MIEGRDAVLPRMSTVGQLDSKVDLPDVLANDDHVVAMLKVELSKTGWLAGRVTRWWKSLT